MTIIRPAEIGDALDISEIWNYYIRETSITFNPSEKAIHGVEAAIEACRLEDRAFLVAQDDLGIFGFATYFQFRGGVGYTKTMEHTILTAPRARRLGVGLTLMSALCDHAKSTGVKSLWACVSADNPAAAEFHERIGFSRIAVLPEVGYKFNRWIDLILLQKIL